LKTERKSTFSTRHFANVLLAAGINMVVGISTVILYCR